MFCLKYTNQEKTLYFPLNTIQYNTFPKCCPSPGTTWYKTATFIYGTFDENGKPHLIHICCKPSPDTFIYVAHSYMPPSTKMENVANPHLIQIHIWHLRRKIKCCKPSPDTKSQHSCKVRHQTCCTARRSKRVSPQACSCTLSEYEI
jgi:hypothetical protein